MDRKESVVILSLGSNLGERENNISKALSLIQKKTGEIIKVSDNLETEPLDFKSENKFLNCCCSISTKLDPISLLNDLKNIEKEIGRTYTVSGYQDRIIDIDIIFYSDDVTNTEHLRIPHPNFRKRKFVTIPLEEISNHQDPITFITISQFNK
jgi:2-amino-4-hydroxy-6-hydroxymethyldihydropteridine diphosphokinase